MSHGHIWSRNSKFVAGIVAAVGLVCDFRHQEVPKKGRGCPNSVCENPRVLSSKPFLWVRSLAEINTKLVKLVHCFGVILDCGGSCQGLCMAGI